MVKKSKRSKKSIKKHKGGNECQKEIDRAVKKATKEIRKQAYEECCERVEEAKSECCEKIKILLKGNNCELLRSKKNVKGKTIEEIEKLIKQI